MRLLINGAEANSYFTVTYAETTDNLNGKIDTTLVQLKAQTENLYQYAPREGETLTLIEGAFNTGPMPIDTVEQTALHYTAIASTLPNAARDNRNHQGWEDVAFSQLLNEFAGRYGLSVQAIDTPDPTYKYVRQNNQSDLAFVYQRCILESCAMKVNNGRLIVYPKSMFDSLPAAKEYKLTDSDIFEYHDSALDKYDGVEIITPSGKAEYKPGTGSRIYRVYDIPIFDLGAGQRFCEGIYKEINKGARLIFDADLDSAIAAGSVVGVVGYGQVEGRYVVRRITHIFTSAASRLELLKLE